ncbi:MAG: CD1871A family CXXC motif-containing protein [Candidatus Deferrimicrobiota bacterium]
MALATGFLVFGVFREEMGEVMFNAAMLCLSCIGIG